MRCTTNGDRFSGTVAQGLTETTKGSNCEVPRARRLVRQRDGSTRPVQPRRARCGSCHATRVLLSASCQPRLADATEVVGAALAAKATGLGYRRIAATLARPRSTVRRWLRRARAERHIAGRYARGVAHIDRYDPEILAAGLLPQPTRLGDALQALAAAVHAY
jgi:transposase-like protein